MRYCETRVDTLPVGYKFVLHKGQETDNYFVVIDPSDISAHLCCYKVFTINTLDWKVHVFESTCRVIELVEDENEDLADCGTD